MNKTEKGLLFLGFISFGLAALMFFIVGIRNAMYLLSIPFELIGKGLRWISLSSTAGNMIALLLYVAISLIPLLYLFKRKMKKELKQVDLLLPVISIYSFYMIYQFVNPGLLVKRMPSILADISALPFLKVSLVIIFYSLCVGYLILRLAGSLSTVNTGNTSYFLCIRLKKILLIISALYTFSLSYFFTFQMFVDLKKYGTQDNTAVNTLFVFVKYFFMGMPIVYSILILIAGIMLLKAMILNHRKEEEIKAATWMGIISKRTVYVTVVSNISLNFLQFLLSRLLSDTAYNLEISVLPLIIAFSAMILSGYFKESKELYEENEMII